MKQQQEQRQQQQQEHEQQLGIEQQQISENRKKVTTTRKDRDRDKGKEKKKVQYVSIGTSGESRKRSKDPGNFGKEFGMQMITDRFGDGWHKIDYEMFKRTTNCGTLWRCSNIMKT